MGDGSGAGRAPEAHWLGSLAQSVHFRSNERLSQKNKSGKYQPESATLGLHRCVCVLVPHAYTCTLTGTCYTHTHTHRGLGKRLNKGSLLGLESRREKVQRSARKEDIEETCTHRPNSWVLLEGHRGMCSEDWPGVVGKVRPLPRLLAGEATQSTIWLLFHSSLGPGGGYQE